MPENAFRIRGRKFLLTYSQTPSTFDPERLQRRLDDLAESTSLRGELHRDGGHHYHCFILFDTQFHSRDPRAFDVDGHHPNIKPIRFTPRKAYDYATKDGDVCHSNINDDDIEPEKRSNHWHEIIACESREQFFEMLRERDPRMLVTAFSNISKYADWAYRPEQDKYESPVEYAEVNDWVGAELSEWYAATVLGGSGNGR